MQVPRKDIFDDCKKIKNLLAKGLNDYEIKRTLNLTDKKYRTRIKYLAQEETKDSAYVFAQYCVKKRMRIAKLMKLCNEAIEKNQMQAAATCIKTIDDIDEKIMEVGGKLGLYEYFDRKKISGDKENPLIPDPLAKVFESLKPDEIREILSKDDSE